MIARLSASQVFRRHLLAILALALLNLLALIGDAAGVHTMVGLSPLLRLSDEGNLPTLFSATAIAATALVAARLAQADNLREGERRGWLVFAGLLAFMAIDEAVQLHELLTEIGLRFFHTTGPWLHIGVFPYAPVALFLAVFLFRFWARQSRAVRFGIALAGLLYLGSAVGVEFVENILASAGRSPFDPELGAWFAVQEIGEMTAVALFLRTFLVRFAELGGGPLLALTGARHLFAIEIPPTDGG